MSRNMKNRYVDFEALPNEMEEEQQGLIPCRSMDLTNDPRFFNDNVLDKRLAAFTALSVVSSIMVGAACDNFVPFEEDRMKFDTDMNRFRSVVALFGFFLMCIVFLMNVISTMVFGVQFYYVYRLMTAGQVGFESAKTFYLDADMTWWRQLSVNGLIRGMPLFVMSVGCMLVVKVDGDRRFKEIFACVVLLAFLLFALFVYKIARSHEDLFRRKYYIGNNDMRATLMNLESGRLN